MRYALVDLYGNASRATSGDQDIPHVGDPRRRIKDVAVGLFRVAIRRLPIAKQSAVRASTQVVGSGMAA